MLLRSNRWARLPDWLLALALCTAVVSRAIEGHAPNQVTRDAAALFQTDSLRHTLHATGGGFDGEIGVTFTNRTSGTVFIVNCNGATVVYLEKRIAGQWTRVWSPPIPLCLGPPITVRAGATYRTRLRIFGGYPGTKVFPQFSSTDIAGEYRAGWANVLSSYQDRPPFGDPLPIEQRLSNRFMLATERR